MTLYTALRGSAIVVLTAMGENHLPISVTLLSTGLVLLGGGLVAKRITKGLRLKELTFYHLLTVALILLSFVILRFYPADVSAIETLITGTLLDVLMSVTFVVLAYRKKRYVTIQKTVEAELEAQAVQPNSNEGSSTEQ